jgi:hypothetical protein
MRTPNLDATKRPRDAVLLVVLLAAWVVGGALLGVGWVGTTGGAVIFIGGLLLQVTRDRRGGQLRNSTSPTGGHAGDIGQS